MCRRTAAIVMAVATTLVVPGHAAGFFGGLDHFVFYKVAPSAVGEPFAAFGPQIVPPGPRMTSMRSMLSSGMSCTSQ